MYSSPDAENTNLKMIYTLLCTVHPSPAQKVFLWHNTGIISYINPLIALEIHWKIDEDFGQWPGLDWILWISAKIVKKGGIDTEQTHQQVKTLENKGLSVQNIYFCGSISNREVEKYCESTTKLLNP